MVAPADAASVVLSIPFLWIGARWLVDGAARLARAIGVSSLIVGLTVVAFGTSSAEIAVSIDAARAGQFGVSVGNVVGSNVFNLGVILGCAALLRPFRVTESLVRRDAVAMAAATGVAIVAVANLAVSRPEGAVLTALLVAYVAWLARSADRPTPASSPTGGEPIRDGTNREGPAGTDRPWWIDAGFVVVGLALVLVGGRLLVDGAAALAVAAGVSEWFVGATVVAAGTSAPELVTAIVATRRGDVSLVAGAVVGSNVFNALGVLGIAALVHPLAVGPEARLGLAWLAVVTLVAAALLATGRRITRLEGGALAGFAIAYWATSVVA